MAAVTIASNATVAKLVDADRDLKLDVQQLLSYLVEGAENVASFKSGRWDGRSSFFDFRSSTFPAGFVHMVAAHLTRQGHTIHRVRKPLPPPLGEERPVVDDFGDDPRYDYQMETVNRLAKHGQIIAQCATGCHAKGTKVLMYNGTFKNVEDVVVGDVLMGPNSLPRNVLALHRGRDLMYRILPLRAGKCSPFTVNAGHIFSMLHEKHGLVELTAQQLFESSESEKRRLKMYCSSSLRFENAQELPIDPYILGLLIGDGLIHTYQVRVTTVDVEIVERLRNYASLIGMRMREVKQGNAWQCNFVGPRSDNSIPNKLKATLVELGLYGTNSRTKFIPHTYKTASEGDRLQLLAGLIDTDGSYDPKFNYFFVHTVNEQLAKDIADVAASLGFGKSIRSYKRTRNGVVGVEYRVLISGDCDRIPTILPRKKFIKQERQRNIDTRKFGVSIEPVGIDSYFGFEVDGDHLYIMQDFIVTHNSGKSRIAKLAFARIKRPTLFVTTRGILMHQMKDSFEQLGRKVGVLGDSEWSPRRGINVATVQTLVARLKEVTVESEVQKMLEKEHEKALQHAKKQELAAEMARAAKLPFTPAPFKRMDPREMTKIVLPKVEAHQKRREQTIKLLELFEFVILEEAHEASGNSYYEILKHCKNAHYRLALTATPFMKDSEESNMRLMACSGPIGIKVPEKLLIERGILARPIFKYLTEPARPKGVYRTTAWRAAYKAGIVNNPWRNQMIVFEASRAAQNGMSVMILVQQKDHGRMLETMLNKAGVKAEFIFGEDDQTARQASLNKLKDGRISVLIGSTILDVGVDVPAVGMVILAGGGKAEVALRQRIGRGLRAKKFGPNIALIVDFDDPFNSHLRTHALTRRRIVESTPGFAENILPEGVDFDFVKLGLAA